MSFSLKIALGQFSKLFIITQLIYGFQCHDVHFDDGRSAQVVHYESNGGATVEGHVRPALFVGHMTQHGRNGFVSRLQLEIMETKITK